MTEIHHKNSRIVHRMVGLIICGILSFNLSFAQENTKLSVVVIDAGHGGKDPGAKGKFSVEKDIVLNVALKLGKYIQENFKDIKVIYTRDSDVFIPLHERADIANKSHADLFISIHANADPRKKAIGSETYAMGLHKSEENMAVAKLENAAILMEEDYSSKYEGFDPNSTESYIIFELMQNIHLEQSLYFASFIQSQFRDRAKRADRGVKQAGFLVLWKTTMPSVLVELGYISHAEEEKFMSTESGQDILASAVFRAFREYKESIESKSRFMDINQIKKDIDNSQQQTQRDEVEGYIEVKEKSSDQEVQSQSVVSDTVRKTQLSLTEENVDKKEPDVSKPPVFPKGNPITFHIQIMASNTPVPLTSDKFLQHKDVKELKINDTYKYVIGSESDYTQALKLKQQVLSDFPGAFIIAVSDGTRIVPLEDAIKQ